VISIAVMQLIPDPLAAQAEMARVLRPGGRLAVILPTARRAARFWRNCRTPGHMCSAKTNSVTSWRTTALSAYGPRISALFNGCAANAADTAALNTMTASANVPARMSCTVEWLSSSRTTVRLPSGASVAGSGRGREVPAEIRWVGMNSRMCRNAQRTLCGCCQFDTLTQTSVGGGKPPGPRDHCHRDGGIAGARSSPHRPSEA
jgi:hypothetical protein